MSILASCVFADVSKGWCILPQLKHILSILLVHHFLAYVPCKKQLNFICLPLQQSVKTSLKKEVTHLCNSGRHQFSPIILSVKNKAPLVLSTQLLEQLEIVETRTTNIYSLVIVCFNHFCLSAPHPCTIKTEETVT